MHCHVVRRYFWRWLCERERERGDMNKSIKCILQTARKFRHWLFCFTQNARTPQPERKINEPNNFLLSVKIAQQYPLKYNIMSMDMPFYMLGTRYSVWHITFYMMCVCVCNPPLYHILFFNNYFKCVRPARTAVEWSGDDWGIYTIYSDSQSVFMHVITRWISYMCLHLPHSWQLSNPSIDFVVVVVNLRPFPFVKLLFSSKLTTQVYTFYEMWMAWMAILFWRPAYAITAMQNKQ